MTLALISYNQEDSIRVAAESCLCQDYRGPLEIIFSDDFSTDSSFEIMKDIAEENAGPNKIILRRNPKNIGIGEHYNAIISSSTGDLIITLAGDDISMPGRVSRIVEHWINKNKVPDLITSNLIVMTSNGEILNEINVSNLADWKTPESWVKKRPYVVGAAHAFTPRMHRKFGNFVPNLVYEDQVMAFRATLMGGGEKISTPLVFYRQGGVSQGDPHFKSELDYLNWLKSKFSRQYNQYLQIQKDAYLVDRQDLWVGKLPSRLNGARLVLDLFDASTFKARVGVLMRAKGSSWIFRVKYLFYISFPAIGIYVKRIQSKNNYN